jgi:acetyltransferase-like isoleucine patch superfamily enzyme
MAVRSFIKRVLNKLASIVDKSEKLEHLLKVADVGKTSIMIDGLNIDFRVGNEDRKYVTIGEKCLIKSDFIFESQTGNVVIGNNVHIGGATFICRTQVEVKDDVTMAWGITLYDHNSHSIHWSERQNDNHNCYNDYVRNNGNNIVNKDWNNVVGKPIVIQSKVWIGFNVTILKGVTIGEGAVIGACSVVTKDVEAWTVVGGNPATLLKRLK